MISKLLCDGVLRFQNCCVMMCCSSKTVLQVLQKVGDKEDLTVVVVDNRPRHEGEDKSDHDHDCNDGSGGDFDD